MMKKCSKCDVEKTIDNFTTRASMCRECKKACDKIRYAQNKDKVSIQGKKYYEKNREKRIAYQLEYYRAHKEERSIKSKEYYQGK